MDSKNQRLAQISEIIQNEQVTSQEQLLKNLISQGFIITQATLSRDLKLLKVAKVPDSDGTYRYNIPESNSYNKPIGNSETQGSLSGFISLEVSGNMGVIRTIPAFAQSISSVLDATRFNAIIGTIAGDDTIFLVIRAGNSEQDLRNELIKVFPDLIDKLI